MRDPFGVHRRRVRRAISHLLPGDAVVAFARDDITRDYWVITAQELVQLHTTGAVRARLRLDDTVGSVTDSSSGVSVRLSSRRDTGRAMIGTFRGPNDVTRRLADLVAARPSTE